MPPQSRLSYTVSPGLVWLIGFFFEMSPPCAFLRPFCTVRRFSFCTFCTVRQRFPARCAPSESADSGAPSAPLPLRKCFPYGANLRGQFCAAAVLPTACCPARLRRQGDGASAYFPGSSADSRCPPFCSPEYAAFARLSLHGAFRLRDAISRLTLRRASERCCASCSSSVFRLRRTPRTKR